MLEMFLGPGTRGGRALFLNDSLRGDDDVFNRRDVHAAEVPAANGIGTASALAKIYAATLAPVDGVQLLSDEIREQARATITPDGEPDLCLVMPTTFGMGFMTYGMFTPYAGPGSFGHSGAGGSNAFAQPERDLAVGYVMNKMAANLAADGTSPADHHRGCRSGRLAVTPYSGPRSHHRPRPHAIISRSTAASA